MFSSADPYPDEDAKNRVKLAVLNLLYEKYNVTEREFITAELEIVPPIKRETLV